MTEQTQGDKFKQNLVDFIVEIKSLIDKTKQNIDIGILTRANHVIETLPGNLLIEQFIENSFDYWDEIVEQKESSERKDGSESKDSLFIEHADVIFGKIDSKAREAFKNLYTSPGVLSEEDKEIMWAYVYALVGVSLVYVHLGRVPFTKKDGSKIYRKPFLSGETVKTIAGDITKFNMSKIVEVDGENQTRGLAYYASKFDVKLVWPPA